MSIPAEKITVQTPQRDSLHIPFDPEYAPGAHNAVNVCLRVQTHEQVCVITDEATIEIAASLVHELEKLGAPYHSWVLEELAKRPLVDLRSEEHTSELQS